MSIWPELREIIEHDLLNDPRSLQKEIGPSELGIECLRCLGHKLAGTPERKEAAWAPARGRAVHAWLADLFEGRQDDKRWLVEQRVKVGKIVDTWVEGSADLFDCVTGTVVDWKKVGDTTLRNAKKGPSGQYRAQAHLYGRGFELMGLVVNRVSIIYLPANKNSLDYVVDWEEPYDESVALAALARAEALVLLAQAEGWDNILPTLPRASRCFSCKRYPSLLSDPAPTLDDHFKI